MSMSKTKYGECEWDRLWSVKWMSWKWMTKWMSWTLVHKMNRWTLINEMNEMKVTRQICNNANKHKRIHHFLALRTFGEMLIVFSTKVNLLYLLYSITWRCCLLYLIKQNCFLKTFLRALILIAQVSFYLFSLLESQTAKYFCNSQDG